MSLQDLIIRILYMLYDLTDFEKIAFISLSLVRWLWVNACVHKFTPGFTIL